MRKLSADEIVGQCLIFLLAGFDVSWMKIALWKDSGFASQTTSNSLAYVTHFLANHSDVQQKLLDEIDSFLAEHEVTVSR